MQQEEEDYFQSEDFLDILRRYTEAMNSGDSPYMDSDELIDVADYYMSKGKYQQAINATELALELHPSAEDPLAMMADIMFESRKWEEAIVWLNKVLDANPFDVQAWLNLSDAHLQMEHFAEALDSAEYALAIQPENKQALIQKAYALSRQERYQEADDVFTLYLSKCPDDELALYHSAFNLCFLERFKEANDRLILAEELSDGLSPEHMNICLQRSYTEARIGNMQEALDALERSKSFTDPDTKVDYDLLSGHIYLLFQDKAKATECFSEALSKSQDYLNTMRTIAQVFMDCQNFEDATYIFLKMEEMIKAPEYDDVRDDVLKAICPALAYCYYQTGHRYDFYNYLKMSISINPKDTQFFFKDVFPVGVPPEEYPYYIKNRFF